MICTETVNNINRCESVVLVTEHNTIYNVQYDHATELLNEKKNFRMNLFFKNANCYYLFICTNFF